MLRRNQLHGDQIITQRGRKFKKTLHQDYLDSCCIFIWQKYQKKLLCVFTIIGVFLTKIMCFSYRTVSSSFYFDENLVVFYYRRALIMMKILLCFNYRRFLFWRKYCCVLTIFKWKNVEKYLVRKFLQV